jgi:hypothetical protein
MAILVVKTKNSSAKDAKGREVKKKQMAADHTLPRLLLVFFALLPALRG